MSDDTDVRAQWRENEDPEEAIRPMPLIALLIAVFMVLWAVVYIIYSEPLDNARFGDQHAQFVEIEPFALAFGANEFRQQIIGQSVPAGGDHAVDVVVEFAP